MIKKKTPFEFKNPLVWGSAIVSLGIVFTFLTKIVDFFRIPEAVAAESKRIDKLEESTQQIADVLKEQQVINNYIHKQEVQHKEKVLSPDGRKFWNEDMQKWEKIL